MKGLPGKRVPIVVSSVLALSLTGSTFGLTADFSGNFSANFSGAISLISGNFSFFFNEPIPPSGLYINSHVPLTSLSLSPAGWGSTTFSPVNTAAKVVFADGTLNNMTIGGDLGGSDDPSSVTSGTDDFAFTWLAQSGKFSSALYTTSLEPYSAYVGGAVNGTLTVEQVETPEGVPLPAAAWPGLAILAALGAGRAVRARTRATG